MRVFLELLRDFLELLRLGVPLRALYCEVGKPKFES